MVIQRWQTVLLLLAAVAMAVFTFMPVMNFVTDEGNFTISALGCGEGGVPNYMLLILDVLVTILLLITIFKYRDLKLQMILCKVSILLILTVLVIIAVSMRYAEVTLWTILPVLALCLTFWAHGRIKADRKLLFDSERIR